MKDDIERILSQIGGTFGKFQTRTNILLGLTILLTTTYGLDYVFVAIGLEYRCLVPECETKENTIYEQPWIEEAIAPGKCERYAVNDQNYAWDSLSTDECTAMQFNKSNIISCSGEDVVYRTDELSAQRKFSLTCDEDWKLAMVGTVDSVARLFAIPILGILSDKYGRKRVLITTVATAGIIRIIESFMWSFQTLLLFKIIDAAASSSIFPCAFILIMENIDKNHRVLMTSITLIYNASGAVILGAIALAVQNFEWLLRILGVIGILFTFFGFFFDESLRWLIVNKKKDESIASVERIMKLNGIRPSSELYTLIAEKCEQNTDQNTKKTESVTKIFSSKKLFIRMIFVAYCWIVAILLTYGISVFSVSLPGDKYTNYIVVGLGNLPGILLYYFMLNYMERRPTLSVSFIATGLLIISSKYVQSEFVSLMLFFVAKSFSQHLAGAIYIYTTEMWPTTCRHSILGLCSMFGRIGMIMAPLMPLTAQYSDLFPHMIFCIASLSSGIFMLFLPETFNKKLPDSFEDLIKLESEKKETENVLK